MVKPHKKKIQRNVKLSEDEARLAWLKQDEQEAIRELNEYLAMEKRFAKYPKIVAEIQDEIEAAKNGLLLTRTHIRILEEQMRILKRVKTH